MAETGWEHVLRLRGRVDRGQCRPGQRRCARLRAYSQGTVALVAMASGLIADGGSAATARPGVNELRVEGKAPNPDDAQRILQSIRNAKQRADLVVVYQHNHVFDRPFGKMMRERLPERLVPPDWLVKWTHAEVDAGADIIVMHGAPLLHGVEIYRERPIFF
jgi:poly-gamma-glutamate capsule biosynthesis protein CapA/YwtB (metallophosphatase superfamily)